MAYEVTASRKRPKNFTGLVGQEFVAATLKNALKTGRIAHAYLFSGPRGVGKTSTARILARALNCPDEEQLGSDGCYDYPGAEEISRGTALDVIEIDGASNTSVNDIRAIKDEVLFPPQSSRYKIYIIDEVHMLSNSAFNALLKTIEEPPHYIIFIFATTEIHKVPATIRSRCQQFNFRLIPLEEIIRLLTEACEDLGVSAEEEALFWIARESTGSMRDAYTLFDQIVSFSGDRITLDKIKEKLGLLGLDELNRFAALILSGETEASLEYLDTLFASGASVEQLIIDMSGYFRSVLFMRQGIQRDSLLGYPAKGFAPEVIQMCTVVQLEKIVAMLLQAYRDIRYTLNARLEFELLVSRLTRITDYFEASDIVTKIRELKRDIATTPLPSAEGIQAAASIGQSEASKVSTTQSTAVVDAPIESPQVPDEMLRTPAESPVLHEQPAQESIADGQQNRRSQPDSEPQATETAPVAAVGAKALTAEIWKETADQLRDENPSLAAVLENCLSYSIDNGTLHIEVASNHLAGTLRSNFNTIAQVLGPKLERNIEFEVTVAERSEEDPVDSPKIDMMKKVFRGDLIQ